MRKKQSVSLLLTVLLGPLGLFYSSAWQAVVMMVAAVVSLAQVSPGGMLLVWAASAALGVAAVANYNDGVDERAALEERRHSELVEAARQGASPR